MDRWVRVDFHPHTLMRAWLRGGYEGRGVTGYFVIQENCGTLGVRPFNAASITLRFIKLEKV